MGDSAPPAEPETSFQRGSRGRRWPRRGRGGSWTHQEHSNQSAVDRVSQVNSGNGDRTQNSTEHANVPISQPSQYNPRNRSYRGRGRGNANVSNRDVRNENAEDGLQTYFPKRHFERISRGVSQSRGTGFNPHATPFIPNLSGPAPTSLNRSAVLDSQRSRKGYRSNEGFYGHNRQRGGNPGNRRKPFHRVRSDKDDAQEKSMRERLINQLEDNRYECAICCQIIFAKQAIWSCKTCYHMFHISGGCIINWAKKSKEDDNKWRCPTCQTKYDAIPYNYLCFCGKQRNPAVPIGEVPHSCGNVCGGQRAPDCPHRCNEPCHPGPCPECPVMLTRRCNCGNIQKAVRCGSTLEVKCEKICDRLLACGDHRCIRVCHDGDCEPCDAVITQACFCGSSSREVQCCEKGRTEKYSCGSSCPGMYSCGIHQCSKSCHPSGESGCGTCPSAPERITHCPCGRCSLQELGAQRQTCVDPIPTCGNVCSKVLKCGTADKKHRCRALCHAGECPPCDLNSCVICRCKQVKRTLPCTEYVQYVDGGEFLCEKRCKKKKSCGIHKCQELCCVQTDHLCFQICGKRLSCGLHFCESLCHAGQCPRCLNSSFDEQFCHCGRTMRPPPIPCGAPLPECFEPCARPHACDHPVTHRCHGDERCPPCTALVERMCYGKHELRKNIPCHIEAVSCGRVCDKPLGCGVHNCTRNCHAGECLKVNEKCTKPCSVLRRPCEHPCSLPCHGLEPCPESECRYPINVTCECGKRKSTLRCSEFEKLVSRLRAIEAEDSEENPNSELPGVGTLKRSASQEKLNCMPCDDECKKAARNKKLAEALQLVTDENGMLEREPTITFTDYMKTELRTSAAFVIEVEKTFLELLDKLNDPTFLGPSLNYNFRPMSVEKRRFIHEYAAFFSIATAGVDDPPKRSVIATAKRGISRAPLILLTFLQKYPGMLKAPGSVTLKSSFGDDKQQSDQQASEDSNTSSLKALRGGRQFRKRIAPQIACPSPLPQFNHFSVLRSDDEEEAGSNQHNQPKILQSNHGQEKDPNWWSDGEDGDSVDEDHITLLLEKLVLQVCDLEKTCANERSDDEECKNSWSDDE